jgi:hypothetical protein
MKEILRVVAVSLLLFATMNTSASATCTCIRGALKAAAVRGRVVATYEQRPEEPIANATVKVMKCLEGDCQTIAELTADENGRFSIEGIKSGEYEIVASARHFQEIWVKLKVRGRSTDKKEEIVFGLEPGLACCAGWAKVEKANAKVRR